MGKIKRGILGGFSGKVANIIGGSWKGIAYMRSQPLSVSNPNTAGQQAQRNAMSGVVFFALQILAATIKPCWDRFAQQMSGYNAFVQQNIEFFDENGPTDYSALVTSQGSLLGQSIDTAQSNDGTTEVEVQWTDNAPTGNASSDDEAYVVCVNEDQYMFAQNGGAETRGDEQVNIDMPSENTSGDNISTYLAFRKADGTIVSNSTYDQTATT
jgi:hypothetical protein|tara:strand:- start:1925 stop:2560 length:636 start_codon:yes stop_codon:yes gene_type:complete